MAGRTVRVKEKFYSPHPEQLKGCSCNLLIRKKMGRRSFGRGRSAGSRYEQLSLARFQMDISKWGWHGVN